MTFTSPALFLCEPHCFYMEISQALQIEKSSGSLFIMPIDQFEYKEIVKIKTEKVNQSHVIIGFKSQGEEPVPNSVDNGNLLKAFKKQGTDRNRTVL